MKSLFLARMALLLGLALALPACRTTQPPPPPEDPNKPKPLFDWDDAKIDSVPGAYSLHVSVDTQKATLYRGGVPVAWTMVASGVWKYPTPAGKFRILEKTPDKNSNLYGKILDKDGKCINEDAKMGRDLIPEGGKFEGSRLRYWMRLTGDGVGMHVGPIPRPGRRASHGCIRLPAAVAGKIYARLPRGTPVTVTDSNPPPKPKPEPVKSATPAAPGAAPAPAPAVTTPLPAVAPAAPAAVPAPATPSQPAAPATPTPAVAPVAPAMKAPTEPGLPPKSGS